MTDTTGHHLLGSKSSASSASVLGKGDFAASDAHTSTTLCGQVQSLWTTFTAQVAARFRVRQSRAFAFWLFMLVVTGSGVNIYLRTVLQLMPDYSYFVFQSGVLAFLPAAASVVAYKLAFTNDITPRMRSCRLMPRFFVMATLDSLEDLAVVVASNHASIAVQTLLPQGVLPLTMAFSACLLRARFHRGQLLGAAIILAGVVFVVVPLFTQPPDPSAPASDSSSSTFFTIVIFAANVPGALSSIWKQVSLQRLDMDVFYLNTVITFFQVFINFALSPLNALPAMGGIALNQIPTQFQDGASCLLRAQYMLDRYPNCDQVWWRWLLFVTCVFLFNWSILQIVKFGSASFMYVASALTLPVTNVMATSALVMGGASFTSSITNWDLFSLISTVVGLLIYGFSGDEYVAASGKPGAEGGNDAEASQYAVAAGHSDDDDAYDSDGNEFEDGDDDDEGDVNGSESDGAMPANACTGCPCCAACLACFFDDPADSPPSAVDQSEAANNDITIQQLGGSPLLSASERRQQRQQRNATASTTASSADTDATAAAAEGPKRRRRQRRANVFVGKFGGTVFMAPQRTATKAAPVPRRDARSAYLTRLGIGGAAGLIPPLSVSAGAVSLPGSGHASPSKTSTLLSLGSSSPRAGFPFSSSSSASTSRVRSALSGGMRRVDSGNSLSSSILAGNGLRRVDSGNALSSVTTSGSGSGSGAGLRRIGSGNALHSSSATAAASSVPIPSSHATNSAAL